MTSDTRRPTRPAPATPPARTPDSPRPVELELDQLREVTGGMNDDPHGAWASGGVVT
ncbi:MAG: hypothetical protein IAG13_02335 [Deltaproteobacteria bacterium]|nr:hypothetical protein [Nannocystaceae bacterium]